METFSYRSRYEFPVEHVFAWHERPGALERMQPPWQQFRVLERSDGIDVGAHVVLQLRTGPLRTRIVAQHIQYQKNRIFVDSQVQGPFSKWVHRHVFEPEGAGACSLEDRIDFELPGGAFVARFGTGTARKALRRIFSFRHERLRTDLERHARFADRARLRVAISGASGMVGSELAAFLETGGHQVLRLVRRRARSDREIYWDPESGSIDPEPLEGVDAVVHLAGESISSGRWTDEVRRRILESRTLGTRLLAQTLAGLDRKPRVFVSASAIGYYGDRGDELLAEDDESGQGFLSGVCREWEAAASPAVEAGIRVVHPRIGIVLSPRGGALSRMLLPFRAGVGGPVGSGDQYWSWIALDDLVGLLHHLVMHESVSGAVNAVAPEPETSADFARVLGRVLGRPSFLKVPEVAITTALGDMGRELLLASARVDNARIDKNGFEFEYPDLESALRAELGR